MEELKIFSHSSVEVPEDCTTIISPSNIAKFFKYPKVWYEEVFLGKKNFRGNTSTVLGTICHHIYDEVSKGNKDISRETINSNLNLYIQKEPNSDVDIAVVKKEYPLITQEVVNSYILPNKDNFILKTEFPVYAKIKEGIYVAGTCDRFENDCVVDFKTVSTKPNETSIPFEYKIQLLAYSYCLRSKQIETNRIRVVYGVRPTKTIPARCIVVTEQIDYESERLIYNTLQLMADTIITAKKQPELIPLLFKSYDLKEES